MRTKISIGLVLLFFGLVFLVAGGVLAAKKSNKFVPFRLPVADGAGLPEASTGPSPVVYEGAKVSDCTDINSEVWIIQHDQWGSTYYDYQSNGSLGRMIAVGPGGHRHMVFHETETYPYPPANRYVTYNCKDPLNNWLGPTWVDGGPNINAGYPQMHVMHDGREIILYHHSHVNDVWHSTLAIGDSGEICSGFFANLYDIPDVINEYITGLRGYWPKGAIVHDADADIDYIHIVETENTGGTDEQTIGYLRCHFEGTNLVCVSPGYGPYIREPNTTYASPLDEIAVIDTIMTISAVAVSSPVSRRVAIIYTKHRANTSGNNDVFYIESMNNGDDWLDMTQWPPSKYNITNYPTDATERAYCDVAACYDYNDSLHIVWNAHWYDSVSGRRSSEANLYHWSKKDGISMIAPGYWDDTEPGAWCLNLAKMSVSAQNPIYHPGDPPYIFVTWTQFNPGDTSASGMGNGDIYTTLSNDGGATWAPGFNLTNTQTPDCVPGECLSEHWSSLAENMYDGDLHIEYVCDRDAGAIVGNEGTWTENPMMYLHVPFPFQYCGAISYSFVDPPLFTKPPIKVLSSGSRAILLEVTVIYGYYTDYEVTSDHPKLTCQTNCDGYLSPGESKEAELLTNCGGQEEFINASITIRWCIGQDSEDSVRIPLYAVCSDDYYECDRDSLTWIEKDNCTLKLWACVNTEERLWDKRIVDEDRQNVIFSGGVIVATTADNDTVVGRQDFKDTYTGARDTINVVQGSMEPYVPDEKCIIQKIHVKDTYIWTAYLLPPNDFKWWWIDIHKQIILFHDLPGYTCPEWKKQQVIKHIRIDWSAPPMWWLNPGVDQGHEDIYLGVFADIEAPFDDGCNGCNTAGYDYNRQMIWQHGYSDGSHPEYEDHYVGLALTDPSGALAAPLGVQNVLNEEYLYPQEGWGWKDGELYQLAATPGVNIHYPDSVADRTVVLTAGMIPAGDDTTFEAEYILIEVSVPTGLADLQAHMDTTREVLIPELLWLGIFEKEFPTCGDVNSDGDIDVGDVIYLLNYLFGPASSPPEWPINRADINNDGAVDVGDAVGLINHLFLGASPPECSGFGRE